MPDADVAEDVRGALSLPDARMRLQRQLTVLRQALGATCVKVAEVERQDGPVGGLVVVASSCEGPDCARPGTLLPRTPFVDEVLGGDAHERLPMDRRAPERSWDDSARDIALDLAVGSLPHGFGAGVCMESVDGGAPRYRGLLLAAGPEPLESLERSALRDVLESVDESFRALVSGLPRSRDLAAEQPAPSDPPLAAAGDPRGQAERVLELEERHARFIESTNDGLWFVELPPSAEGPMAGDDVVDAFLRRGAFTEVSAAFAERFDPQDPATIIGMAPGDLPGFWITQDHRRLAALASDGFRVRDLAVSEVDQYGRTRHLRCTLFARRDRTGALRSIWGIERDVTDEVEESHMLRESAELYRAIARAALDGICVLDADLSVLDCNDAFADLVGTRRERLLLESRPRLTPTASGGRETITFASIAGLGAWRGEAILERADGEARRVELSCRHSHVGRGRFYCFVRDLTTRRLEERREREHQEALAHVSRLSTLGEMASGIAHEFNQPLGAIVNYANGCVRLLEQAGVENPMVFRGLRAIADQGGRAAEIIQRLRSFARRSEDNREPFHLSDLLTDAAELLSQPLSKAGVQLDLEFEADRDEVVVDGIQVEQVTINLLLNAIDAFARGDAQQDPEGPGDGRRILIRTRTSEHQQGDAGPQGRYVETMVCDNGAGISAEAAAQVFDPFFNLGGKGLGLGLTIARSTVDAHGGSLWLDTSGDLTPPDFTTCFRFTLPLRQSSMNP